MANVDFSKIANFNDLLKGLQKDYGKEIIKIGNDNEVLGVEWWSLDSPNISFLFGKGFPKGRIVEIFSKDPGVGKTSLAYYICGQIQKQGGRIIWADTEFALDKQYAEDFGVNLENLLILQADYQEQTYDVIISAIESNQIDLVVIDSISSMSPLAEFSADSMESNTMGLVARNNSQFLRKVVGLCKKTNTSILALSQSREKIGVLFGKNYDSTGGKAYKFASSLRLEIFKKELLTEKDRPYGIISRLKLVKNKLATPYMETEIRLIFGQGIDVELEWITYAVQEKIIEKGGAWYTLSNGQKFQGIDNLVAYLKENKELYEEIKEKVKKIKFSKPTNPQPPENTAQIQDIEGVTPPKKTRGIKKLEGVEIKNAEIKNAEIKNAENTTIQQEEEINYEED